MATDLARTRSLPDTGRPRAAREPAEVLRPRHVPLPLRRGPAHRPPRGLHGDRRGRPQATHGGIQRPPPDGLGRLRAAGGACRGAREPAPATHHAAERGELPPPDRAPRLLLRLGAGGQHVLRGLLPLDAVDLPGTAQARPRLPGGRAGLVVPGAGHRTGERRGQGRRLRRYRRPGRAADDAAVDAPDHCLRRAAAGGPRRRRLARVRQGDAAQLDRQVPRRRDPDADRRRRRELSRVHDPAGHALRRHLLRTGAGAPARFPGHDRRTARRRRRLRRRSDEQDRTPAHRPGEGQDRRVHRRLRHEPGHRRADADLGRRLRPDELRLGRDHGRAGPGPAGLGLRRRARPADRAHRPAACRLGRRRVHGGRPRDQQRLPGRPPGRRREGADDRVARRARPRHPPGRVPAARLAVLAPALLGRAVPGAPHAGRRRRAHRRDPARAARGSSGRTPRGRRVQAHRRRPAAAGPRRRRLARRDLA